MNTVALIGIDLGKHSFHLQAQDHNGRPLFRKQLSRPQLLRLLAQQPVCRAAMEACAGAHCLAREIQVQQTLSVLHRLRESLIRDCTKSINQLHGFLLEFGISLPRGMVVMRRLATVLAEHRLPPRLVVLLQRLHAHFGYLDEQIKVLDRELVEHVEADDLGSRLLSIPGVGPITSSVLLTELGDARQYRSSRDFAASVGLVPRQHSTGGRQNLLGTSKRGDKNLRRLLADWVRALLCRRHSNVVACALANKLARIAWALAQGQGRFETGPDGCAA